ncbi:hypothetical protein BDV11DRAFT_179826 [Aspergillus similis]
MLHTGPRTRLWPRCSITLTWITPRRYLWRRERSFARGFACTELELEAWKPRTSWRLDRWGRSQIPDGALIPGSRAFSLWLVVTGSAITDQLMTINDHPAKGVSSQ